MLHPSTLFRYPSRYRFWLNLALIAVLCSPLLPAVGIPPTPAYAQSTSISFKTPKKVVQGVVPDSTPTGFHTPTSIEFFQDRLYVATYTGQVWIFTLNSDRVSIDSAKTKVITLVAKTPNYNNNGSPAPSQWQNKRLALGITVDPASSAGTIVLYVTHSDPRWGGTDGVAPTDVDADSGMLTRLTLNAAAFASSSQNIDSFVGRHDVIVGLPRSGENHATNGMSWGADGSLYIAQGGNTNNGTPGSPFGNQKETPLSAAVLRATVKASFFVTGTLNVAPIARLADLQQPPYLGLFEVFATGLRNAYDVVMHSNGRIYANDNGANTGFGSTAGSAEGCPGLPKFDPGNLSDRLAMLTRGSYAGHPAPVRGECVLDGGNPTSGSDPFQRSGYSVGTQPHASFVAPIMEYGDAGKSTNGIAEYTSGAFGGAIRGQLIIANFGGTRHVSRIPLGADGKPTVSSPIKIANNMGKLIDVAVSPAGVLYLASLQAPKSAATTGEPGNAIFAIEPAQLATVCPLPGDPALNDSDGDGYQDRDEQLNATDPCSAADRPADFDGDLIGDLSDPDDDNDGLPDSADQLLYDAGNGANTQLPLEIDWFPTENYGGIKQSGMTGALLRNDGGQRLNVEALSVGGAAGFMGIPAVVGSSEGIANTQTNALAVGFNATQNFSITARVSTENFNATVPGREGALFFGTDADNYVKLAVGNFDSYTGIELGLELGGVYSANPGLSNPPQFNLDGNETTPPLSVDLFINGNIQRGLFIFSYRLDNSPIQRLTTLSTQQYPALTSLFRVGKSNAGGPATNGALVGLTATKAPGDNAAIQVGFDMLFVNRAQDGLGPFDPASLQLEASDTVVKPGGSASLVATARDSFGDLVLDGTPLTLTTSLGSFANGQQELVLPSLNGELSTTLTYGGTGLATVVAYAGAVTSSLKLNFANSLPNTITLSRSAPYIYVNTTGVISAEVRDQFGRLVPNGTEITLTTSLGSFANGLPQVLATTSSGRAAVGLSSPISGTALISATTGSVQAGTSLRILAEGETPPAPIMTPTVTITPTVTTPTETTATPTETTPPQAEVIARINAGHNAALTLNGVTWSADTYFTGGSTSFKSNAPIANTTDDALYQSERSSKSFSYAIPVPAPGTYTVRLHFAEIYWSTLGKRKFDVNIEGGALELDDYDIVAVGGINSAVVTTFNPTVSDGVLNIVFSSVGVDRPKLSALEVLRPGSTVPATTLGSWAARAPLPSNRAEVGVATLNGKVYVVGGISGGTRLSSMVIYEPLNNSWQMAPALPGPARDHIGVAVVSDTLYAIGGLTGWPGPSVRSVYAYNPTTNLWTEKAPLPDVDGRGAMGVAVIDNKIYAVGGLSKSLAVTTAAVYDPATDSWKTLKPMAVKRDHLVAEAFNGKLYAIGGRNKDIAAITNAHEVYDPVSNTWSAVAALPTARGGMGSALLNNRIYVFGGEGNSNGGVFAQNEEYNPVTNSWRPLTSMQTPRHGTDGAVVGNQIYVPGGGPSQGGSSSTTHEVFTIAAP